MERAGMEELASRVGDIQILSVAFHTVWLSMALP